MHIQIVGQTECGKTTLAKRLSGTASSNGTPCIIFDPKAWSIGPNASGWSGLVTRDWSHFREVFWASRGCLVFIDEARRVFIDHREQATLMLTEGRHNGHSVALIAQRHKMLELDARDQCGALFAFLVGAADARELAEDWADDSLRGCCGLPLLDYYYKRRGQPIEMGKIVF